MNDRKETDRRKRDEEQALAFLLDKANLIRRASRSECPSEDLLAGYASGTLVDAERHHVEEHLAGCAFCLDGIALAAGVPAAIESAPVDRPSSAVRLHTVRRAAILLVAAAAAFLFVLLDPVADDASLLEAFYGRLSTAASADALERCCAAAAPLTRRLDPGLGALLVENLDDLLVRFRGASASFRSIENFSVGLFPTSPLNACRSDRPLFRFRRGSENRSVEVAVLRRSEQLWAASTASDFVAFPDDAPPFVADTVYNYFLTIRDQGGHSLHAAGPFFFTILDEEHVRSLDQSLGRIDATGLQGPARDLFRAVILSRAGLYGEALPLLESLVVRSEGGAATLMLIATIQAAMGNGQALKESLGRLDGEDD